MPTRSRMAAGPPETVTLYFVFAARDCCGSSIHWLVLPSRTTAAATNAPVAAVFNVKVVVPTPWTASLKVTATLLFRLTRVSLIRGVKPVSVGAGPVKNVQLVVAKGVPALLRMAVVPPTSVAVYVVSTARLEVGSRMAVRVVAL